MHPERGYTREFGNDRNIHFHLHRVGSGQKDSRFDHLRAVLGKGRKNFAFVPYRNLVRVLILEFDVGLRPVDVFDDEDDSVARVTCRDRPSYLVEGVDHGVNTAWKSDILCLALFKLYSTSTTSCGGMGEKLKHHVMR